MNSVRRVGYYWNIECHPVLACQQALVIVRIWQTRRTQWTIDNSNEKRRVQVHYNIVSLTALTGKSVKKITTIQILYWSNSKVPFTNHQTIFLCVISCRLHNYFLFFYLFIEQINTEMSEKEKKNTFFQVKLICCPRWKQTWMGYS